MLGRDSRSAVSAVNRKAVFTRGDDGGEQKRGTGDAGMEDMVEVEEEEG